MAARGGATQLPRIATPETETRWRAAAAGKNVREIEELVAGHRRGDQPDDPADPEATTTATGELEVRRCNAPPPQASASAELDATITRRRASPRSRRSPA